MDLKTAKEELKRYQEKCAALEHAMSILYYDGVTTAPRGTAENRARTLAVLSEEEYRLSTSKETGELLSFLDENKAELDEKEKREVELLVKSMNDRKKIPMDEYIAYETLIVEAEDVWHTAKEKSNFALFEPYLTKIFETNIRFAGYLAPEKKPYDYWLNEYEDGLNTEICDNFFGALKKRIVPLIEKVRSLPQVDSGVLYGDFPAEKQRELSKYLMDTMGLDPLHVGLSETEHPFTTPLGSHLDERITTHYYTDYYASSMFSVIHEGGHALYDTGSDDDLAFTVLDGGVSMGIHESQSRFYENILGRSEAFLTFLYPKLTALFPSVGNYTPRDLFRAANRVEPSLIRTEADEVTYPLHVMIRYELEKRVMAGELAVHDLPAEWNRLYKEYLGVEVPDDKHGVLQDSHWSGGSIGYFPSYALGSAYGAQFLRKMKAEGTDPDACLRTGDFAPINEWNRTHIWRFGSLYKPGELLDRVLGEPFDPNCYLDYLEAKVKNVYGL